MFKKIVIITVIISLFTSVFSIKTFANDDITISYEEYIKLLYDLNIQALEELSNTLPDFYYSGTDIPKEYNSGIFDILDGSVELSRDITFDDVTTMFLMVFKQTANDLGYLWRQFGKSQDEITLNYNTYKTLKEKAYENIINSIPQDSNWYMSYYGRNANNEPVIKVETPKNISVFGLKYQIIPLNELSCYRNYCKHIDSATDWIHQGTRNGWDISLNNSRIEFMLIDENGEIYSQVSKQNPISSSQNSGAAFILNNTSYTGYGGLYTYINNDGGNKYYKNQILQVDKNDSYASIYYSNHNEFKYTFDYDKGHFNYYAYNLNTSDYYRIEFNNLYIKPSEFNYETMETKVYNYEEIMDLNLTPIVVKNISTAFHVGSNRYTESIIYNLKSGVNLNGIADINDKEYTIPLSEVDSLIENAIKNALIDEDTKISIKDGAIVKIDDMQIDELKEMLEKINEDNNEGNATIIELLSEMLGVLENIKDYMSDGYVFYDSDGNMKKTSFWDFIISISDGILDIVNTLSGGFLDIGDTIVGGLLEMVNTIIDKITELIIPNQTELETQIDYFKNEIDNKIPVIKQVETFSSEFTQYLESDAIMIENEVVSTGTYKPPALQFKYKDYEFSLIDFQFLVRYRKTIHTIIIVVVYLGSVKKIIRKITSIF